MTIYVPIWLLAVLGCIVAFHVGYIACGIYAAIKLEVWK
jgi:hypothetical protein